MWLLLAVCSLAQPKDGKAHVTFHTGVENATVSLLLADQTVSALGPADREITVPLPSSEGDVTLLFQAPGYKDQPLKLKSTDLANMVELNVDMIPNHLPWGEIAIGVALVLCTAGGLWVFWQKRKQVPLPTLTGMDPETLSFELHARALREQGYEVTRELGRGGMAIVYEAQRVGSLDGMPLALKLLNRELSHDEVAMQRMRREIKVMKELVHPGIVPLHDYGEVLHQQQYLVMEKVEGKSLRDVLDREGLSIPTVLQYAGTILEAVGYAHERGILHRDLKPDNIMVRSDGKTQVLDFGIARSTSQNTFMTMDDSIVGTPAYMPPERFNGEFTQNSDQYALGLMFLEMLTGSHPMGNLMDIGQVMHRQMFVMPDSPSTTVPQVWPELDAWVMKMIAKAPDDRFPSLFHAREALREVVAAGGVAAEPLSPLY